MLPVCYTLLAALVLVALLLWTWLEPGMPSMPSMSETEPFKYGYHSSWGDNVADGAVWEDTTVRSGGPLIDELDPEQYL